MKLTLAQWAVLIAAVNSNEGGLFVKGGSNRASLALERRGLIYQVGRGRWTGRYIRATTSGRELVADKVPDYAAR